jgi:DNA-directed RNA polymerase subunit L
MGIKSEVLLGIVEELGLKAEPQAAFYKVSVGGRSVYIAKTKTVSRVDLSGFDIKHPAVARISEQEAKELKLGKVRGQINFEKPEERVLEGFRTALEMMKHLAEQPVEEGASTRAAAKAANRRKRGKAVRAKAQGRKQAPSDLTTSRGEGATA